MLVFLKPKRNKDGSLEFTIIETTRDLRKFPVGYGKITPDGKIHIQISDRYYDTLNNDFDKYVRRDLKYKGRPRIRRTKKISKDIF